MAIVKIECLYDSGQIFSETWNLTDQDPATLGKYLTQIANVRLQLLAKNIRIMKLSAKGFSERVDMRGFGGEFSHPRDAYKLQNDGYSTAIRLRGIPRELIRGAGIWPEVSNDGKRCLVNLCAVLKQCGARIKCGTGYEPVANFIVWRHTLYSSRKSKAAKKKDLTKLLGAEKADGEWEEIKERRKTQMWR